MPIKAVIWDLGGVLLRTEDNAPRNALAERLGKTRIELENLVFSGDSGDRAQLGEISVDQHWENLRRQLELDAEGIAEFQREFWGGDRLDWELVSYVHSLRGRYKTGLLSNAFSDLRHVITSVWGFSDAFDAMIISAEVHLVKPDPRIYHLALEQLGARPQEAVFIDDWAPNVAGARQVELHAIHFLHPLQARSDLEQLLDGAAR
jgi:epoxide hydrolase-like predicted phosphatase